MMKMVKLMAIMKMMKMVIIKVYKYNDGIEYESEDDGIECYMY